MFNFKLPFSSQWKSSSSQVTSSVKIFLAAEMKAKQIKQGNKEIITQMNKKTPTCMGKKIQNSLWPTFAAAIF